ncbi:MAG: hypothetical protein AAGE52_23495 [Myxococcota bacterium]
MFRFAGVFALFFVVACGGEETDLYCEGGRCLCSNGEDIDEDFVCDGDNDCDNWDDERGCPGTRIPRMNCVGDDCLCRTGEVIPARWICDGDNDCGDFEDEQGCRIPDYDSGGSSYSGGSGGSGSSSGGYSSDPCAGLSGAAFCICATNDIGFCSRNY